jgi:uncharacterized membrane protein YgcG
MLGLPLYQSLIHSFHPFNLPCVACPSSLIPCISRFLSQIDSSSVSSAAILAAASFTVVAPLDLRAGALTDMVSLSASIASSAAALAASEPPAGGPMSAAREALLSAVMAAAGRYATLMLPGEPAFTASGDGGHFILAVASLDSAGGGALAITRAGLVLPPAAAGRRRASGGMLGVVVLSEAATAAQYSDAGGGRMYKTGVVTVRVTDAGAPTALEWACPAAAGRCLTLRVPVILPSAVLAAAADPDTDLNRLLQCLRRGGGGAWAQGSCEVRAFVPDPAAGTGAATVICDATADGSFRVVLAPLSPPPTPPPTAPPIGLGVKRRGVSAAASAVVGGVAGFFLTLILAVLLSLVRLEARKGNEPKSLPYLDRLGWEDEADSDAAAVSSWAMGAFATERRSSLQKNRNSAAGSSPREQKGVPPPPDAYRRSCPSPSFSTSAASARPLHFPYPLTLPQRLPTPPPLAGGPVFPSASMRAGSGLEPDGSGGHGGAGAGAHLIWPQNSGSTGRWPASLGAEPASAAAAVQLDASQPEPPDTPGPRRQARVSRALPSGAPRPPAAAQRSSVMVFTSSVPLGCNGPARLSMGSGGDGDDGGGDSDAGGGGGGGGEDGGGGGDRVTFRSGSGSARSAVLWSDWV